MRLKIQCPNCNRSLTVADEDAGHAVMCAACGHRVVIPRPVIPLEEPAIATPPPPPPPVAPDRRFAARENLSAAGWWTTAAPASAARPVRKPQAVVPQAPEVKLSGGAAVAWVAIALIFIGLIGVATFLAAARQRRSVAAAAALVPAPVAPPAWDPAVRAIVLRAVSRADDSVVNGHLQEADDLYAGIERAAATQPAADPFLQASLEGVAARRQTVKAVLASRAPATAPVAVVVPPPSPVFVPATLPVKKPAGPPGALRVSARTPTPADFSDELVGKSIARGVNYLIRNFDPQTHALKGPPSNHKSDGLKNGLNALCVYALLQAGQALPDDDRLDPRKPAMRAMLDALDKLEMEQRIETYGRGLRASALSLANRKEDRATLQADALWLEQTHKNAAFAYGDAPASKGAPWDNSNTQYGQLGLWAAEDAGIEVPTSFWVQVQKHWNECQDADGTWNYMTAASSGSLSMTCAGLASLFVAHDYLDSSAETASRTGRPPFPPALAKGLAWFETGDNAVGGASSGYTLYGIERVGLASGFKFFGRHDWYRELARQTLARQVESGSWGDGDPVETSYALLFLSRGRHPIMMNKLRFDGAWANRPRDVANLTRFAGKELERPLNWQVVSADRDYESWTDSPVLYIASHQAVHFTNVQVGQIRRYVDAGGLLFTQADAGSKAFNDSIAELATKLFPEAGPQPIHPIPADHELFSLFYTVDPKPPLQMVSNGIRPLMIHSPTDITSAWQQRSEKLHPAEFKLGVNLFLYTSGKGELRNRLAGALLAKPPAPTGGQTTLARLRYGPDDQTLWDPEPAAWPRFASWFGFETSCAVDVEPTLIAALKPRSASVAHLTGARAFTFSGDDAQTLRAYVDAGGTLLVDCAGGGAAFADSATRLIGQAFPDKPLQAMPTSHPLLLPTVDGMEDLSQPFLRPYALRKLGPRGGVGAVEFLVHGRGRVIYTGLDVTAGLLGTNTWGILGFQPRYAQAFVKNVVLWAAAGAPGTSPAAAVKAE